METSDDFRLKVINAIKLLLESPLAMIGPSYHVMNKQLAQLYLGSNEELKGIYCLTEAHAASLRQQTIFNYDHTEDHIKSQPMSSNSSSLPAAHGINKTYVMFGNEGPWQNEQGLLSRLKDMPKEWIVVQVTRHCEYQARFSIRPTDSVTQLSSLHITRLPCGEALDEAAPVSVMVGPPQSSEGMPTIFDLMSRATKEYLRTKKSRPKEIFKARLLASEHMKEVVEVMSSGYLREWRCLLLGSLCNNQHSSQVKDRINQVLDQKKYNVDSRSRQLLYSVAEAAVHLSSAEVQSAVCCLLKDHQLASDLIQTIAMLKDDFSVLTAARRHPVILILDEGLDSLPWEMLPILKRHPVSRVPSIHFLHALYHEHKDHIVNGCRLINKLDIGFYVINPEQDLKEMESRLAKFLEKRMPEWKGMMGSSPTEDDFCNALIRNNIFLYCGHFNGSQYLRPEDVCKLRVVALPLLFGCSSVALQDLGGRTLSTGVSDKYIMAGSACVVGMLWTVTSDDTDCMTVMLLNGWLPGQPVDLTNFRRSGDMLATKKEPELLRLLRCARETAFLYSNSAALVARGIPVKMIE